MPRTCKIYSLMQYSIINYCHYPVHYIPMTDCFYTWNFLPFDPFNLPLWQLPVSTVLYICELSFCLLESTYKWNHTVFLFLWLISLSIMLSRSIHVVTNGKIPFFFMAKSIPFMCTCVFFTHSSADRHRSSKISHAVGGSHKWMNK